jgi:hypothetical protein
VSFGPASPDAGVKLLRQLFLQCTHANNMKRTQRLAEGELAGGVREEGLPSQPAQLQPFGLFRVGRF